MTADLRRGDRRRHARHGDRGRPVPGRRRSKHGRAADGYDAVQLAFDAGRRSARSRRPSSAISKKAGVERRTGSSSSSAGARASPSGETVTVEVVRARRQGQGLRHRRSARASRARSSGTASTRGPVSHGSHNVRKPGSIGASATPSRVFKGHEDGRPDGRQARHAGRADRASTVDAERNLLLVKGAVPGPKNGIVEISGRSSQLMASSEGTAARRGRQAAKEVTLDGDVFGGRREAASRPRGGARRAERAARAGTRGRQEPRARLRRPREAVAPEGHRARRARARPARRSWTGGGVAFAPGMRELRAQGQPQGAASAALRGAPEPPRQASRRSALVDGGVRPSRPRSRLRDSRRHVGPGARRSSSSRSEDEEGVDRSPSGTSTASLVLDAVRARGRRASSGRSSLLVDRGRARRSCEGARWPE